ncbi:hypothetical protein [Actinoplanes philippinensis]|uniref:hypothetical protein n=1 Tax=Actinoplanes philippinensis TaxID=35752 RepID=UPI0033EE0FD3
MQRIEVGEDGVTLTHVTEPRYSVFGNLVSPGHTSVSELSWDEVSRIGLTTVHWDPAGPPQACLVIDLTYGEFFEITDDAEGFGAAVRELCRRHGAPVPDHRDLPAGGVDIRPFPIGD